MITISTCLSAAMLFFALESTKEVSENNSSEIFTTHNSAFTTEDSEVNIYNNDFIKEFKIRNSLRTVELVGLQDDVLSNISAAMKAGSSKELIKYCNNNLEIKLDGKTSNYSISQAEMILRDFFLNNPPKGFDYIHQGSSPEGLKYTIGTYKVDGGSYRVVMVIKKSGSAFKIDTINFSRE